LIFCTTTPISVDTYTCRCDNQVPNGKLV